jgi:AcrR family transcriptional regulator
MTKRSRLAPEARRDLILAAARPLVLEQGYLPLASEALSRAAGVSKALVYAYFPTPAALYNTLVERGFAALAEAGLETAASKDPILEAALGASEVYFEHVAKAGPLIHVILRDRFMRGRLGAPNRAFRDRIARSLARKARRQLGLRSKDAVAAMNLILAIPEETGRLVWQGELDRERGRELCRLLVESGVASLGPAAAAGRQPASPGGGR